MGCCEVSSLIGTESAEILVCKAESSLNLSNISPIQFDRMLYRYSKDNYMSILQFSEFCRLLNIDLEDYHTKSFFNEFTDPKYNFYHVKPLSTLGVLLCVSKDEEKLRVLFQNYDENSDKLLSKNEIRQMISDICSISLNFTPSLAQKIYKNEERELIESYRKKLNCMKTAVLNYFMSLFDEDSQVEISIDDFVRILKGHRISCILNSVKFRRNTMKMFELIQKAVAAVNYVLDEDNRESKEVYKQIIKINHRRNK